MPVEMALVIRAEFENIYSVIIIKEYKFIIVYGILLRKIVTGQHLINCATTDSAILNLL